MILLEDKYYLLISSILAWGVYELRKLRKEIKNVNETTVSEINDIKSSSLYIFVTDLIDKNQNEKYCNNAITKVNNILNRVDNVSDKLDSLFTK
jgi:hypothetical protein